MENLFLFIFLLNTTVAYSNEGPCKEHETEKIAAAGEELDSVTGKVIAKLSLTEFYKKSKEINGLIVKGSVSIEDISLVKAGATIEKMLSKREDIRARMILNRADIVVIAKSENYCDIPEARNLRDVKTFDGRSFCDICGGGGVPGRPITTVCEDNLLKTTKDPYFGTEDILTHEFAHAIHILGMEERDKTSLTNLYNKAKEKKIFEKNYKGEPTYMMANEQEFFACLSAAWFGVHNPKSLSVSQELVNRNSIREKLPDMYEFMKTIYPE
ncbi:MAG: hypothetical protein H7177_02870 [Rhizobacter sp.]|nr:hypothetical protein [Bacteriovorax sp.]